METLNAGVLNKLSGLLFFLKRSKKEFEMVADEIENHSLKTALNGISEESSFYAGELKNYLKYLGISAPFVNDENIIELPAYESDTTDTTLVGNGNELENLCIYNEKHLTGAYSELLDEQLPFESFKEIILYQLNALKYSFMKIKTLNTARFAVY